MRIGIHAAYLGRSVKTGIEVYAEQIIKRLVSHREHQFVLIGGEGDAGGIAGENVETVALKSRGKLLPLLGEIGRIAQRRGLDTLFFPTQYANFGRNPNTVSVAFDVAWHYFPEYFPARKRLAFELLTRNMVTKASRIIAISQATKSDLMELYGADGDQVEVVHLGYDPVRYKAEEDPLDREVLSRYGLEKGGYLLYLGTLQKRKNLIGLVRAYAECGANLPLVLAGGCGWFYEEIAHAIESCGRRDSIILPGYVKEEDKAALYRGCAAFAYPSLYEGFGLPVLEAMACGRPVLSSNVSSLPEVLGDTGVLADPLDVSALAAGLRRCLGPEAEILGKKAAIRARDFSWDRAASRTLGILKGSA